MRRLSVFSPPVGSNPFSSYFLCIAKETLISQSLFPWLIPPRLIQYEKTKAGFSLIVGGGKTCQEQHGLHFVQAHGLHIFSWVIDQTVAPLHAINEQIPKSAQMPLFTSRKHFEQRSLAKHNFWNNCTLHRMSRHIWKRCSTESR